jgi:hypothetical protein
MESLDLDTISNYTSAGGQSYSSRLDRENWAGLNQLTIAFPRAHRMGTLFLSIGCGNNASNDKLGPGYPSFQLG